MQINQVGVAQGNHWIAAGWERFRENYALWLMMAAIYLLVALTLQKIPYLGYPVLVLITPLVAANVVSFLDKSDTLIASPPATPLPARLQALFRVAGARLLGPARDSEHLLPIMVVAAVSLGAMIVIQIFAQLLKVGGAAVPAMLSGSVGVSIWAPAVISLVFVWTLKLSLVVMAFFAISLIVSREETPLMAMESAIRGAAVNALPLSILAIVFLIPLALASYFKPPASDLALLVIGLVSLPLFVTASYSASRELFAR